MVDNYAWHPCRMNELKTSRVVRAAPTLPLGCHAFAVTSAEATRLTCHTVRKGSRSRSRLYSRLHLLEAKSRKVSRDALASQVLGHEIRWISVTAHLDHLDAVASHGILQPQELDVEMFDLPESFVEHDKYRV